MGPDEAGLDPILLAQMHARLSRPRATDVVATWFARLVAERRERLLAVLAR